MINSGGAKAKCGPHRAESESSMVTSHSPEYSPYACCKYTPLCAICAHRRRTPADGHTERLELLPTPQHTTKPNQTKPRLTNTPLSPRRAVTALLTSGADRLCLSSPSVSSSWPGWPSLQPGGEVYPPGMCPRKGAWKEEEERENIIKALVNGSFNGV